MELLDILAQAQNGQALRNAGQQFGLSDEQTLEAFGNLAPVIAAGIRRNVGREGGYEGLMNALADGRHERYFDDPDSVQFDSVAQDGNKILGHIFGSKDVSRGVAMQASGSSGIGSSILKQLLPIIASMVLGSLTKRTGSGSGSGLPFPLPDQAPERRQRSQENGGILGDILKEVLGGGRTRQQQPQGGGGMIEDIVKDVLGGGASPSGRGGSGGGALEDIFKDVLGGGNGSSGRGGKRESGGGLTDILGEILGGGSSSGRQRPSYDVNERPDTSFDDSVFRREPERGRGMLEDILGRGSPAGNAADDLLSSVEDAIRRR
ncbi:MAG: DUF937 domain-containing protein [Pseudomonadota bacterium]